MVALFGPNAMGESTLRKSISGIAEDHSLDAPKLDDHAADDGEGALHE